MSFKHAAAAAAVLSLLALPAVADTGARHSSAVFRIQGVVPVICRVQMTSPGGASAEDGLIDLGVAREFCNAPRGYRVILQHRGDVDGAAVISGGERIPLSASGETVLTDSHHADFRTVALALDLGESSAHINSLGIRIEARV